MAYCAVFGCSSSAKVHKERSFYRFPAIIKRESPLVQQISTRRRLKWIANVGRKNFTPNRYSRVCDLHFVSGKPAPLMSENDPSWAPTVNMNGMKDVSSTKLKARQERYERLLKRTMVKKNLIPVANTPTNPFEGCSSQTQTNSMDSPMDCSPNLDPCAALDDEIMGSGNDTRSNLSSVMLSQPCFTEIATQTDLCSSDIEKLEKEVAALSVTANNLRKQLEEHTFSQSSLESLPTDSRDARVKFYTGLPTLTLLITIYEMLAPRLALKRRDPALTLFQQFVLTLMKLRLNLRDKDLAYRFKVDRRTVARYFGKWIEVLYCVLVPTFVTWPDREALSTSMPMCFRDSFMKCVSIIDCFEIFIVRSKKLKARAMTYSNYKSHNTVKFLISIAPQGAITFVSPAYGGRSSDQFITQDSGFLDNLVPGDLVLADRGFDIKDHVEMYCAELQTPTFTQGKKQLASKDIHSSRNLSHV